MRCTTPSVLSLGLVLTTAAATAVTPAPRNGAVDYGSWDFSGSATFPVSGYTSYRVDATYRNAELTAPVAVISTTPGTGPRRHRARARASRQANTVATVALKQNVALSGANFTVTRAREFDFDFSGGAGFTGTAADVIEAKTATA
ncbi:hypothetical protein QIS74_10459 [Colletotrichum tabaci]|uniref:Uncharacterized protein n=1 Tax=Colletotrichum tabaci TaxID=1209068 RepID=A0AAV9T0R8_9PEZI